MLRIPLNCISDVACCFAQGGSGAPPGTFDQIHKDIPNNGTTNTTTDPSNCPHAQVFLGEAG